MKKVAIYARYRSDRQSEHSIEDQVRLCRERADREGWSVVDVFPDFALSGATRDRPGLNAMLARVGEFDVILARRSTASAATKRTWPRSGSAWSSPAASW
ncbi:recombinase family protein [Sphingomonas sp.]|jgi:DNA invertase Pin-like site-specific DNA recombinase|uniref:recombinase family protein n=1 Tax=Sphingomonas sp. TaxID=28214 RepID=UPI002ED98A8D